MPNCHRMGDPNSAGGIITSIPQSTVYANGRLVAVNGSIGSGHGRAPHCEGCWATANGGPTVFVQSIPVNKSGDMDTCGHTRVNGSPNVFLIG